MEKVLGGFKKCSRIFQESSFPKLQRPTKGQKRQEFDGIMLRQRHFHTLQNHRPWEVGMVMAVCDQAPYVLTSPQEASVLQIYLVIFK